MPPEIVKRNIDPATGSYLANWPGLGWIRLVAHPRQQVPREPENDAT